MFFLIDSLSQPPLHHAVQVSKSFATGPLPPSPRLLESNCNYTHLVSPIKHGLVIYMHLPVFLPLQLPLRFHPAFLFSRLRLPGFYNNHYGCKFSRGLPALATHGRPTEGACCKEVQHLEQPHKHLWVTSR